MELLKRDQRLKAIHGALEPEGEVIDEAPDPDLDRMEAAVSLIVRATAPLELLIIKRATYEGDPWSGHMALPGGRWEPGDSGLLHTARRETWEETGIQLAEVGAPLGRLTDVTPASPRLPAMRIAPFVFGVPEDVTPSRLNYEVERVHWVAIDHLRDPRTSADVRIHFSGYSKTFPSYSVGDDHVWGLTHRILTGFLARISDVL